MSGFSFVAILAMGQAFPILVRGIDLSIGAIVGVVGMIVFDMTQILHVPGYLILPSAIAVGTLAGALNGVLIVFLRLQPFIATLATLAAYRGFIYAISGRQLVPGLTTTPITDRWILGLESYFDIGGQLGLSKFAPIAWFPLSFFIMLALFALFQIVLLTTRVRAGSLRGGRQLRGRAPCRRQHPPHDHRCLFDCWLLRLDHGAHHGRALHDLDRGSGRGHGAHRDRGSRDRRGEPRRGHRLGVRPGARGLYAWRGVAWPHAARRAAIRATDHHRSHSAFGRWI